MKRIYITQRVESIESTGERRDALSQEWSALGRACGFLPVLLPNCGEIVEQFLTEIPPDGILLTGGNDLACYGGDAPERDEIEQRLIACAFERRIPLLGVCRGAQVLLDYFGMRLEKVEGHVRTWHVLSNGREVNSYHQWGSKRCAPPVKAVAWSEDGTLEEFTHEERPDIVGVMWHPERYHPFREKDIRWIRRIFQL